MGCSWYLQPAPMALLQPLATAPFATPHTSPATPPPCMPSPLLLLCRHRPRRRRLLGVEQREQQLQVGAPAAGVELAEGRVHLRSGGRVGDACRVVCACAGASGRRADRARLQQPQHSTARGSHAKPCTAATHNHELGQRQHGRGAQPLLGLGARPQHGAVVADCGGEGAAQVQRWRVAPAQTSPERATANAACMRC